MWWWASLSASLAAVSPLFGKRVDGTRWQHFADVLLRPSSCTNCITNGAESWFPPPKNQEKWYRTGWGLERVHMKASSTVCEISSCYDSYFFISKVFLRLFEGYKILVANCNEYIWIEYIEHLNSLQVSISLACVFNYYLPKYSREIFLYFFLIFHTHSKNSSTMSNITPSFLEMKGNNRENIISDLHAIFL